MGICQPANIAKLALVEPQFFSATACRYVAAVTGRAETSYCIIVFSCTASKAQMIGQTRLLAGELPVQPWHIGSCIQLESVRSVFHCRMLTRHFRPSVRSLMPKTPMTWLMMPAAAAPRKDIIWVYSAQHTLCSTLHPPVLHTLCWPKHSMGLAGCYRNEAVLFMSSLLQPVEAEQHLRHGVSGWRFPDQQIELTCHMETKVAPHCIAIASGAIAAAGEGSVSLDCMSIIIMFDCPQGLMVLRFATHNATVILACYLQWFKATALTVQRRCADNRQHAYKS